MRKPLYHLVSLDNTVTVNQDPLDAIAEKPVRFNLAGSGTVCMSIEEAYSLGWKLVRATINKKLSMAQKLDCCRHKLEEEE